MVGSRVWRVGLSVGWVIWGITAFAIIMATMLVVIFTFIMIGVLVMRPVICGVWDVRYAVEFLFSKRCCCRFFLRSNMERVVRK